MSVSAYALNTPGTALSWKSSGGDYAFTPTSLANGSAWQGVKGDLGQGNNYYPRRWGALVKLALASAGTNGSGVEVYWAQSNSATAGTENAGNASGTDATYATPAEYKLQLTPIGSLPVSNAAGTAVQYAYFEFYPTMRYGMPVLVNGSGVALSSTAGNQEFRIFPIYEVSATTATG